MGIPKLPPDEESRLRFVRALGALDIGQDDWLDTLAHRALALFPGANSAAVSVLANDRLLFKGRASLALVQAPRTHSFCAHAVLQSGVLVVEDASQDQRFTENPLVTGPPGVRFYAGAPLKHNVGTLCVMGLEPRCAAKTEIAGLSALAVTVAQRLDLHSAIRALTRQIPLS